MRAYFMDGLVYSAFAHLHWLEKNLRRYKRQLIFLSYQPFHYEHSCCKYATHVINVQAYYKCSYTELDLGVKGKTYFRYKGYLILNLSWAYSTVSRVRVNF